MMICNALFCHIKHTNYFRKLELHCSHCCLVAVSFKIVLKSVPNAHQKVFSCISLVPSIYSQCDILNKLLCFGKPMLNRQILQNEAAEAHV